MAELAANLQDLALRYHKDLVVVGAGTAFTCDSHAAWEGLEDSQRQGPTAGADRAEELGYPMTMEGQPGPV